MYYTGPSVYQGLRGVTQCERRCLIFIIYLKELRGVEPQRYEQHRGYQAKQRDQHVVDFDDVGINRLAHYSEMSL